VPPIAGGRILSRRPVRNGGRPGNSGHCKCIAVGSAYFDMQVGVQGAHQTKTVTAVTPECPNVCLRSVEQWSVRRESGRVCIHQYTEAFTQHVMKKGFHLRRDRGEGAWDGVKGT